MQSLLLNNWPFNADNNIIQDRILKQGKTISLKKSQQFIISNNAHSGIYGIKSGLTIVIVDDLQQTRKMNFLRGENEWFGASSIPFEGEIQYSVDLLVEAVEDTELYFLSSNQVLDILVDIPHIDLFIYQHFAQEARETLIPSTIIGTSSLISRISYFLLSARQYYKVVHGDKIPLTQQGIAELINVSRQKVNQSLQQLVNNCSISLHRGGIEILEPALLYDHLLEVLPGQLPKHFLE